MSPDRSRLPLLVGAVALGALLLVGLVLIELLVEASLRTIATRLVVGVVLAVAAYQVRTLVHRSLERQSRSTFELEREPSSMADRTRFDQLHDEIRFSPRSQQYFDAVVWPHLVSLAEARTGAPADWFRKPPGRSFARGPSREALRDLIALIEGRR